MVVLRRGRFLFWLARELSRKYTKSLFTGICIGFAVMLAGVRFYPVLVYDWLAPVKRIGLVGIATPASLPLAIQQMISYGLTTVSDDGTPMPGLAHSWTSTDSGKIYQFQLKPNIVWHDNKPVTSKDINYNINNVQFIPQSSHSITAILPEAYSPFVNVVTKPIFRTGLMGFGPYRVSSLRLQGDRVTFLTLTPLDMRVKNHIQYHFYQTEEQAILAYKLGEIDIIEALSEIGNELITWKNTTIHEKANYRRIVSVFFNLTDPLFKEKSLRQALAYAIPYETDSERAYSPIGKTSWAYTDFVKKYSYDPTQAKKLFSSQKLSTTSAEITITTFSQYYDISQKIASSWNQLGIKTNVSVQNSVPAQYQVLVSALDIPIDPDQYILWHSTQSQANITHYVNVKIDKLLEDGRKEEDKEKRRKLYIDFQKRIVDDAPALFLHYPKVYSIVRKK